MADSARFSLSRIPDDPTVRPIEVCGGLADFFGVDVGVLAQAIGGDWRVVNDRHLHSGPEPTRWLGAQGPHFRCCSGSPPRALLSPSQRSSLADWPDHLGSTVDPIQVDLAATQPLLRLSAAVEQVLAS